MNEKSPSSCPSLTLFSLHRRTISLYQKDIPTIQKWMFSVKRITNINPIGVQLGKIWNETTISHLFLLAPIFISGVLAMSGHPRSQEKTGRIHRHNYERDFAVMPNSIAEHEYMTWPAKAILWYMLSRPADWKVYRAQLAKIYKGDKRGNGKDAIDSIFEELIDLRFIIYTANDERTGKFIHRYDVYPEAQPEIQKKIPKPVKPVMVSTPNGLNHPQTSNNPLPNTEKEHVSFKEVCKEKQQPRKMPQIKGKLLKEVNALSDIERKTFDTLMEVEPASGDDEYFNPVMACKAAKSRTFEQVTDAIKVYRQRLLVGKAPKSMGGSLMKIINDEVKPKGSNFEENINFWEEVQQHFKIGSFKRISQGVTLPSGRDVDFIMPVNVFHEMVMEEIYDNLK